MLQHRIQELEKREEGIRKELETLRGEISGLNKKLDDREEDLIQAKKDERERITNLIDTKKDLVHDGYHGYASHRPCPTCKGCQIEQHLKEKP